MNKKQNTIEQISVDTFENAAIGIANILPDGSGSRLPIGLDRRPASASGTELRDRDRALQYDGPGETPCEYYRFPTWSFLRFTPGSTRTVSAALICCWAAATSRRNI